MLMKADNRAVDYLNVFIISHGNGIHDLVPNTGFAPATKAIIEGRVRALAFRQITPRGTGSQDPENTAQHSTVINTRNTAWFVWKTRFDNGPFKIRQIIATTHAQAPTVWNLESHRGGVGNPVFEYMT